MTLNGLEKLIRTTLTGLLSQTPCAKCGGETSVLQVADNVRHGSIFIHEVVKRLVKTWHLPENMTEERIRELAMKATKRRLRKEMAKDLEEMLLQPEFVEDVPKEPVQVRLIPDLEKETVFTPPEQESPESHLGPWEESPPTTVGEALADAAVEREEKLSFGEAEIPDFTNVGSANAVPPSDRIPKSSVEIPVCAKCGKDLLPGQPCCA